MNVNRDRSGGRASDEFTVLDLDDTRIPPVFSLTELPEERFRNTPNDIIQEYLDADILDPVSRSAAIAELARRGISLPEA